MPDPTPSAPPSPGSTQAARVTSASAESRPRDRFPATVLLCLLWIAVYLGMSWQQGALHAAGQDVISGGIRPETLLLFGSMSPAEVRGGEPWRALTSTFLHASLIHLGFNLLMLYQLGREIETWYGPWQAFGVYTLIGVASNLLASWVKPLVGHSMFERSVGGSGIVCGLIALVAVVGWRSRTRIGEYYRAQMVGLLIFIAIIGYVVPGVDNVVHASGAVAGAAVGFMHRWLVRGAGSRRARLIGAAALALTLASGAAQGRVAWMNHHALQLYQASQGRAETLNRLVRLDLLYQQTSALRLRAILGRDILVRALRLQLRAELRALEKSESGLDSGSTVAEFATIRALAWQESLGSGGDRERFRAAMRKIVGQIREEQAASEREFAELARRLGGNLQIRIPAAVAQPVQPVAEN